MACHKLSQTNFAKVNKLVNKTCFSLYILVFMLIEKITKVHEIIMEMVKVPYHFSNSGYYFFAIDVKFYFLKGQMNNIS